MCKKLVEMMKGNIWVVPNNKDFARSMRLILKFQLQPSIGGGIFEPSGSSEHLPSEFRGLQVILADYDDFNRAVTRKLLEKLGCQFTIVSSGFECLGALGRSGTSFHIILLDLNVPEMDGFEVATRVPKFQSRSWLLII